MACLEYVCVRATLLRLLEPRLMLFGLAIAQRTVDCDARCVAFCAGKQEGRRTGDLSVHYSVSRARDCAARL